MKIRNTNGIIHVMALVVLFAAVTTHAGIPQLVTSKERDWNFIQSVGGMDISVEGTTLTVDCDVSGLKTVTVKPTLINSGIGVRKLKHKRDGQTIVLTLKTCVIGKGVSTSPAPVDLSGYPEGEYEVHYRDPDGTRHLIGNIAINQGSTEQPNPLASWRADNPNIRVTLRAADGANNINIQRGRTSFLNYAVGTPDHRVVATNVTDESYIELRDACFAVLRNPPESVDGGTPVFINVPLSEEEIEAHGLSTNSFTFRYRPGQSHDADALYKLTNELLGTRQDDSPTTRSIVPERITESNGNDPVTAPPES